MQITAKCSGSVNNLIVYVPSSIHHSQYASLANSLNLRLAMSLIKGKSLVLFVLTANVEVEAETEEEEEKEEANERMQSTPQN